MREVFLTRKKNHCLFSFKKLSNCFSFVLSFTLNNRHDSSSAYRGWSRLIVGSSLLETSYRKLIVFETHETVVTVKQHCNKNHSVGTNVAAFLLFPESSAREKFEAKIILLQ